METIGVCHFLKGVGLRRRAEHGSGSSDASKYVFCVFVPKRLEQWTLHVRVWSQEFEVWGLRIRPGATWEYVPELLMFDALSSCISFRAFSV